MHNKDDVESLAPRPPILPKKQKRRMALGTVLSIILIVFMVSFVAGNRAESFVAWVQGRQHTGSDSLDLSSVQDVYRQLLKEYDGSIDQTALIDGAKKGLVSALGDPYTVYFTDQEAEQFLNDLNGTFSGIGAELGMKDNNLTIITTLDDSPARKSGLQSNDIIAAVNGQETTGWSIERAVSEIRGEKGTTVKLTIVRDSDVQEFSIARAEIINPSATHQITADNIGVLRVSRFAEDTMHLARRAAQEFKDRGVRGVVLDLRGNGGGYLATAQELASLWLKSGDIVVQEKVGDKVTDELRAQGNALLAGMPSVVLIDGGSASASEIVAGALHDHRVAQLVGVKTFGKGSVQDLVEVSSGGQLKVTIAKWFTPDGKNISKEGIAPDVEVKVSDDDVRAGRDPQKDKAIELLK